MDICIPSHTPTTVSSLVDSDDSTLVSTLSFTTLYRRSRPSFSPSSNNSHTHLPSKMHIVNIYAIVASGLALSAVALPVPQFAPQNTPQNNDLLKPLTDAMNTLLGSNNGFGNGQSATQPAT